MKKGIRILGIDDASFSFEDDKAVLTGVVYRGTEFIEDIKFHEVSVDGYDATGAVIELFRMCKNPTQIRVIMLDGISFAGFNIVDIQKVAEELERPVIAVTANKPDRLNFSDTMRKTGNVDPVFERIPDPVEIETEDGQIYFQSTGIDNGEAEKLIRKSLIHGLTPEPIRVADMIGRSLNNYRT